jgi:hypothetical protein
MQAVAAEARGSAHFLEALQQSQLYVLALKNGGNESDYAKLVHSEEGVVVWPLFSSWASANTFIHACGVDDAEQFLIVPAGAFIMAGDVSKARLFLNPKTQYQRQLWPEEAQAWGRLHDRTSRPTTG